MGKRILLGISLMALLSMGTSFDVEAKRLGGAKNIGRQAPAHSQKQATPAQPAAPTAQPNQAQQAAPAKQAPTPPVQQPPRRFGWGSMLGGLAAGLGIGWLLSHFGLGEAAASFFMGFLLIAIVAIVGLWLLRRFTGSPQYRVASPEPAWQPNEGYQRVEPMATTSSLQEEPQSLLADFDQESFLTHAKKHFVQLQAAWDRGDLAQLREFATAEMYQQLEQDLQARANELNKTEVVTLDAQLLGIEQSQDAYLASVRFSGMIREHLDGPAESFVEIWNLTKPTNGQAGWVLAGVQQLV